MKYLICNFLINITQIQTHFLGNRVKGLWTRDNQSMRCIISQQYESCLMISYVETVPGLNFYFLSFDSQWHCGCSDPYYLWTSASHNWLIIGLPLLHETARGLLKYSPEHSTPPFNNLQWLFGSCIRVFFCLGKNNSIFLIHRGKT